PPQLEITAEVELLGDIEQMRGTDKMVFEQGKLAFGETPEAMEEPLADQQPEDRVAEEFQPLIVGMDFPGFCSRDGGFVGAGAMRDRARQQRTVREAMPEGLLQFVQIGLHSLLFRRAL